MVDGNADGTVYAIEGDWVQAGLSWGTSLPALGWSGKMVVKGFKWIKSLGKAAKKCDSFPPGTDVTLADGTSKHIEDINIGDKVLATDSETGETAARPVLATIITEDDKHFVDLTIATDDGDGPASIIATTHHPIWDQEQHTWVDAGDLKPGTTLRTPDGTNAHVTAVHHFDKRQRTHNLTIEGQHTYYVLAGATLVLVHNANSCTRVIGHHPDCKNVAKKEGGKYFEIPSESSTPAVDRDHAEPTAQCMAVCEDPGHGGD